MQDGRIGVTIAQDCTVGGQCQNISADVLNLSGALSLLPYDSVDNVIQMNTQTNLVQLYVNVVDCNGIAVFNLRASVIFGETNNQVQIINNTAGINLVVINLIPWSHKVRFIIRISIFLQA
jgi:hypothetical protein